MNHAATQTPVIWVLDYIGEYGALEEVARLPFCSTSCRNGYCTDKPYRYGSDADGESGEVCTACAKVIESYPAHATLVYVDIPTIECIGNDNGAFVNVAKFDTREKAIEFARKHFGADENGMVSLVTN